MRERRADGACVRPYGFGDETANWECGRQTLNTCSQGENIHTRCVYACFEVLVYEGVAGRVLEQNTSVAGHLTLLSVYHVE